MREIEFRGQRVDNGEWVYGYYAVFTGKNIIYVDWKAYEVIPESIGQFTGLKDKNVNKIFEGDKVKLGDSVMFVVEFINGAFVFKYSDTYIIPLNLPKKHEIELIGNIHNK